MVPGRGGEEVGCTYVNAAPSLIQTISSEEVYVVHSHQRFSSVQY